MGNCLLHSVETHLTKARPPLSSHPNRCAALLTIAYWSTHSPRPYSEKVFRPGALSSPPHSLCSMASACSEEVRTGQISHASPGTPLPLTHPKLRHGNERESGYFIHCTMPAVNESITLHTQVPPNKLQHRTSSALP